MYFVFAACLTRLVYNIRLFSKMQALFSKKSYFFTGSFHSTKTAAQTGCIHPLYQIQTLHTSAEPSHWACWLKNAHFCILSLRALPSQIPAFVSQFSDSENPDEPQVLKAQPPKRVVKDFLIKFTKKPQKKCQEADFSSWHFGGWVIFSCLTVRRKGTHIPAVGRYRVSSAA